MEIGTVEIGSLTLESGVVLDQVHLAYEWAKNDHAPTVLVCHGIEGNQHTIGTEQYPGWWSGLIGKGKSIELADYAVITFNVLGGCNGSTGPKTINPITQRPYDESFPEITIRDMVNAERKGLFALGIHHIHTIIGGSFGGMRVLEWGVLYPTNMDLLIPLAVTPSLSTHRVARNRIGLHVVGYEQNNATSNPVLLHALNHHDIGEGRGGIYKAAQEITAKAVLIGFTGDVVHPPEAIRAFADMLPNTSFCLVNTRFGHNGFLTEFEKWGFLIKQIMEVASCRKSEPQYLASVR